jgi:hypothetical protein
MTIKEKIEKDCSERNYLNTRRGERLVNTKMLKIVCMIGCWKCEEIMYH